MDELTCSTLKVRRQETTWFVQIHRPEAGNTIDAALLGELGDVMARAARSTAKVVVLEGLPDVFPGEGWATIFEDDFTPKPAFDAMLQSLTDATPGISPRRG